MLKLDNKYCQVSFLHFRGSKRNKSESFCLVQCLVECIQPSEQEWTKKNYRQNLKKTLENDGWITATSFLCEKEWP